MNHMHNFKLITPVLLSLMLACSPTGKISVTNVNDSGFRQAGMFLYSLPQTVLDVTVEADETEIHAWSLPAICCKIPWHSECTLKTRVFMDLNKG